MFFGFEFISLKTIFSLQSGFSPKETVWACDSRKAEFLEEETEVAVMGRRWQPWSCWGRYKVTSRSVMTAAGPAWGMRAGGGRWCQSRCDLQDKRCFAERPEAPEDFREALTQREPQFRADGNLGALASPVWRGRVFVPFPAKNASSSFSHHHHGGGGGDRFRLSWWTLNIVLQHLPQRRSG